MKKILLILFYFFACIFYLRAQTLFGITREGGSGKGGTINKFTPGTNNLIVAKSFETYAAYPYYTKFIQASNGKLYGMTSTGGNDSSSGSGSFGVIVSFDPSSSTYTRLKDFDNTHGANPYGSLIQASNGKLYGMTYQGGSSAVFGGNLGYGVIFSFDPSSSTYTKLKDFDLTNGYNPYGSLVQASDGKLYGMTYSGGKGYGVIFSFDPSSSTYTKLKEFDGTNGANPYGDLMQANDGKLYGMTSAGGTGGYGVIFSFDPSSTTFTKLKDFDNTNGGDPWGSLIQASDGKLYGTTLTGGSIGNGFGVIFSFDLYSSIYKKLRDFDYTNGAYPGSLMQASDGKLYGMAVNGGSSGRGVIFSLDPSASIYTKLQDFNITNGSDPYGGLMQASNGKFYGMTTTGGGRSYGVIFSYDASVSIYTKLTDLEATDGRNPLSHLIQASDGKLYGMTSAGGSGQNGGVIFSFDPSTSTYTKLKDFDGTNGSVPTGSLMQAGNGKLYGTTFYGGTNGAGVIFSFDPSASIYTKLMDFDASINGNGSDPYGSLMQASNGKLYGMTLYGGTSGNGVIFSFDPSTSIYTKLVDFIDDNGSQPWGSLMQASNGKLYGMTPNGGSSGSGIIFSFDPLSSNYTKLKDFDGTNGSYPYGHLIQASDGKLYGMAGGGGSNYAGVIFSFDPLTSTYTKLKDFGDADGAFPLGSLMQASDGKLYGMTLEGGSGQNGGVIFSFDPSTSTYTKLKDFDGTNGANPSVGAAFIEVSNSGGSGIVPAVSIITSAPNPACEGQSVTFTATPTNGGTSPIYQWKLNGTNVGTNSPTYTTNTLTNGQVVSCVMTSNDLSVNPTTATSNYITMAINAAAAPAITIAQTSCSGTTVEFNANISNGGSSPTYLWSFTGTGTASNFSGPNFTLSDGANGAQVQCRLTSNATCADPIQVSSSLIIINCLNNCAGGVSPASLNFGVNPNPVRQEAVISFSLCQSVRVSIDVLNAAGQQMTILEDKVFNIGNQTILWNSNRVAAGVYFVRFKSANYSTAKKVVVIH